jgi:hypothetical protein
MDDALVKLQSIERSLLELSQQTLHPHDVRNRSRSKKIMVFILDYTEEVFIKFSWGGGGGGEHQLQLQNANEALILIS